MAEKIETRNVTLKIPKVRYYELQKEAADRMVDTKVHIASLVIAKK